MATARAFARALPRHPHSIVALRQNSPVHKLTLKVLAANCFKTIPRLRRFRLPPSPPQPQPRQHNRHGNCQIEALEIMRQSPPMPAKQISRRTNRGHPNRGSKEVKKEKLPPRHVERPRQQRGQHAHAEKKSRQKNGGCPIPLKKLVSPLHRLRTNRENMPVAFDQRTPAVPPQCETDFPARRRSRRPRPL